jgi:hypothetical protein
VDFVVGNQITRLVSIKVNSNVFAMSNGPDDLISLAVSPALEQKQSGPDSALENGAERVDELEPA